MSAQETEDDVEQASVPPFWPAEDAPLAGSAHLARHAERLDRYQQLIQLREAGFTQKEIARRLGMGERTVRHWLTRGIPYASLELRRKRRRGFDPYAAYVRERFFQGSRNGLQLWRELQTRGDIREVRERCIGSSLSSSKVPLPEAEKPNDHKLF
jgi:transcriptional regulator with XRE-family HTH domain